MTNNEIVTQIYRDNIVGEIMDNMKVDENYYDDLYQEVMLALLRYDNAKLEKMVRNNEIRFFISRIICNLDRSKTSTFYFKYKKFRHLSEELCNST